MEIHRLDPNIVAKIKSSITINSVTQCITELVLNSLDAKSTAVAVRVNFVTFRIQVVDNGDGITEENLNLVGGRHMTSKCKDLSQLESHCPYYGFRGEALASIINVSEVIEVVSKPRNSSETWCRKFKKSVGNDAISVKDRPSCGTTVTVESFLYNFPLRKKRVIPEVEFTEIKRNMECLIIIHPNVSFSLRNDVTGDLILNSPKCGDVISSLKYLHPKLSDDYSLIKVSKSKVKMKALLFKKLWENSGLQCIYVNKRPIKCSKMQAFIYNLFRKNKKHANEIFGVKSKEKIKHHVYVISIKCPYSFVDILSSPSKTAVEFKNWTVIFSCLEKLILSFLGVNKKPCQKNYVNSCKVKSTCGISQIRGVFRGYGVKRKIDLSDCARPPAQKIQKVNAPTENVDNVVEVPQYSIDDVGPIERQCSVPAKMKHSQFRNTENVVSLKNTNHISEFSCEYNGKNNVSGTNNKINKPNFLCPTDNDLQKHNLPVNHISNKMLQPLPVKVFYRNNLKNLSSVKYTSNYVESKAQKINSHGENSFKNSSLKFTNDENKGKNLIMDMFLKSTQVFNSDDESENAAVPEQSDNCHENKLISDEYNGKNLIMNMFLKSTQVFNSDNELENVTVLNKSDNFLENKLTNDENNGKHLIMDMFLKSTQVYNWEDECQNDKSGDTIFEEESKYVLENNVTTNVNGKSKTMSMSVNVTKKIKKRCNTNKKRRNMSKSIQTSLQKNMVEKCVQTSVCQKLEENNVAAHSINAELAENYTLILSRCKNRTPKFRFVHQSPFNLRYTEYKEQVSENECKCNCHSHKIFNFNNYKPDNQSFHRTNFFNASLEPVDTFKDYYTKQNNLKLTQKVANPRTDCFKPNRFNDQISISEKPFQVNTNVDKSFYFDTNSYISKTVNKAESTENDFNHFENHYTKPSNSRLAETVVHREKDYLKNDSFRARRGTPFHVNKTVNKSFYFSTNSHLPNIENKAGRTEHCFNNFNFKNNVHSNVVLGIDRTYRFFNPQYQSTQMNQSFRKGIDVQKCSPDFSKLNDHRSKALPIFSKTPNENVQYFEENKETNKMRKKSVEEKNNSISYHHSIVKKTSACKTKMTSEHEEELFITLSNRQKQEMLEHELNTEKQFLNKINLEWISQMAACRDTEEVKQPEIFLEEWIKKQNEFGCDFYINKKTGFTTFYTPKQVSNDFKFDKRFEFVPKGLSPILKEIKEVDRSLSQNKKDKLENYILESHQNDLLTIKWQKYIKNNDTKTFFEEMYREKLNSLENCIPTALRSIKYFSELNSSVTFDKALFDNLTVIGQLDKKFIVVFEEIKSLIILFDQHAVHERIRLESLLKDYSNAKLPSYHHKLIVFVPHNDLSLLRKHEEYLNFLGLQVQFFKDGINIVDIPLCLYNKFKDNDISSLNAVIQLLIKEIIGLINDTRGVTFKNFPQIIQDFLNLEACRGAIKFGDALSKTDCEQLLRKLSTCNLPFQCAHGRPTLVPLLTLNLTNPNVPKTMNLKKLVHKGM